MQAIADLKIKIFADGANKAEMLELYCNPYIKGFTTNPTLLRRAGVTNYATFAADVLASIRDRPISFEVIADDHRTIENQARTIATWGPNVYVKIPVTNTRGESTASLVHRLSLDGVKVNVTAVMTIDQVKTIADAVAGGAPSYVSVFAGRIADTGRDPVPVMAEAVEILRRNVNAELIWASPRESLNIFQADAIGCQIITVTAEILKKLELVAKDLLEYSLETTRAFYNDAIQAGLTI